jgi:hypothetical protein
MADIFKGPSTTSIPKNSPMIVRIDFDKSDLGARKSQLPNIPKNDMTIKHVKG